MGVGEHAVAAARALLAVEGRVGGQYDQAVLPPVLGHQTVVLDVEGPHDVAGARLAGDRGRAVEGPDAPPAAVGPADGGDEGEAVVAPLDPRLVELEVGGEEHRTDPFVAEDVGQVEVEGQHAEVGAVRGVGAEEDEREEGEGRRRLRGARAGCRPVSGDQQEAERLVVALPPGREDRRQDLHALVGVGAEPAREPEEGADAKVLQLGRAHVLDQRSEGRPAQLAALVVAGVTEERPQLHVERCRRGRGEGGERRQDERNGARAWPPAPRA